MRIAEVLAALSADGWSVSELDASTVRLTAGPHIAVEDTLVLRSTEHWVMLAVVPFLRTKGRADGTLSRWLLRMNRDMAQAKFSYDADGDVQLSLELPLEALDASEIQQAARSLATYAKEHRATLRAAAAPKARFR